MSGNSSMARSCGEIRGGGATKAVPAAAAEAAGAAETVAAGAAAAAEEEAAAVSAAAGEEEAAADPAAAALEGELAHKEASWPTGLTRFCMLSPRYSWAMSGTTKGAGGSCHGESLSKATGSDS
mmetsp:Transcript_33460/g.72397  ORF Transcript_33460/g.72397 Transcript_33460/m.72397 type:complete len:124 (+) Transcript_33460:1286-1657(+)